MRFQWLIPVLLVPLASGCSSRTARSSNETVSAAARPAVAPSGDGAPASAAETEDGASMAPADGSPAPWPALVEVGVGGDHTCALDSSGAVYCWGGSVRGQLGVGTWDPHPRAVRVHGIDDATDLAVGFAHACAVRRGGRVACWGMNHSAALGDGTAADRTVPVDVLDIDDAVEAAAGMDFTCVRRRAGDVACWGRNLGRRPIDPGPEQHHLPQPVAGLDDAVGLAAGGLHVCALRRGGTAACWGVNLEFAAGPDSYDNGAVPFPVPFEGVRQVAAGHQHTCVLLEGGEVRCWGGNRGRQRGDPDENAARPASRAVSVPGLGAARAVVVGEGRTCVLLVDGTVSCWGGGTEMPQPVAGLANVAQLALQPSNPDGHTCALTTANQLWCWGRNGFGQLGDGTRADSAVPVRVLPPASTDPVPLEVGRPAEGTPFEADEIAVGHNQTCARRDGTVWCWGRPPAARLNPAPPDLVRPVQLPGLDDAVQLAAGFGFFCARLGSGGVACWGENSSGELGNGTTDWRPTPAPVAGLDRVKDLAADYGRACALRSGGEVWCWGDGQATAAPAGALRARTGHVRRLALSDGHWCVLLDSGDVRCQGHNGDGQIGNGEGGCRPDPEGIPCGPPDSACLPPEICAEAPDFAPVRDLPPAVELALGSGFSCARHRDGAVSCWGRNSQGQLGRGTNAVGAETWLPAPVAGLGDVASLCADASRACALRKDGVAVCWGQNVFGELGDRTTQMRPSPSLVHGLENVVEIDAGQSHTCARTADRRVWCWGDNGYGQLGDGSREGRPAPVLVRAALPADSSIGE